MRDHCLDCGEELWGAGESLGRCLICQQREWVAQDAYVTCNDDEDVDEDECTAESNTESRGESK